MPNFFPKIQSRSSVYEPQEDSILLAQAAQKQARGSVLDLGCGTGIVGIHAAQNPKVTRVTFADISKAAVDLAKKNARENAIRTTTVSFLQTDLFSDLSGTFDTICFNPPYLPTEKDETLKRHINKAFDGGSDGRNVLDRFLNRFAAHLSSNGVLLLLNSSVSAKDFESGNQITQTALEKKGFGVEVVGRQRFFFEELVVFKAQQ